METIKTLSLDIELVNINKTLCYDFLFRYNGKTINIRTGFHFYKNLSTWDYENYYKEFEDMRKEVVKELWLPKKYTKELFLNIVLTKAMGREEDKKRDYIVELEKDIQRLKNRWFLQRLFNNN